ncbi:hypothetical protein BKA80DRAFT_253160 [Phyllosticta citrichinensis]
MLPRMLLLHLVAQYADFSVSRVVFGLSGWEKCRHIFEESRRGAVSVHAVRAHKDIHYIGRAVNISDTGSDSIVIAKTTGNITSKSVELRLQSKLTLWVDDIQYKSEDRAVSKGTHTAPTMRMVSKGIDGLSAGACSVDVALKDRVFTLGDGNPKHFGIASQLKGLVTPTHYSRTELAVWLGVAPVAFGASVNGMQPTFERRGKWLRTFAWSSSTCLPDETAEGLGEARVQYVKLSEADDHDFSITRDGDVEMLRRGT